MTTTEAYEFTMQKVNELKEFGIKVVIKPSCLRDDKKTIEEYKKPDTIPPDFWNIVTFKVSDAKQARQVHEAANYLLMCGIAFDVGGCCGSRDWELDWSFNYNKGNEDWELRDLRDKVEDIINNKLKEE